MSDNIVLIDLKPYTKQMFVQVPCLCAIQACPNKKTTKQSYQMFTDIKSPSPIRNILVW